MSSYLSFHRSREFDENSIKNYWETLSDWDQLFSPHPWSKSSWESWASKSDSGLWGLILTVNGGDGPGMGFTIFKKDTIELTSHLLKVLILPEYRNLRLGQDLLRRSFELLESVGMEKIFLEVDENQKVAQHIYKKLGFKGLNLKRSFYSGGANALSMVKVN